MFSKNPGRSVFGPHTLTRVTLYQQPGSFPLRPSQYYES